MTLDSSSETPSPSGTRLWLVLWHAAHAMEEAARRNVEAQGLCLTDFAVLEALLHKGPLPVNTIGRRVLLSSGSITAAVDRLERRGLVSRGPHPTDRRARLVALTDAGAALIAPAFDEHARALELSVTGLSAEDRRHLIALLLKLEHSIGNRLRGATS